MPPDFTGLSLPAVGVSSNVRRFCLVGSCGVTVKEVLLPSVIVIVPAVLFTENPVTVVNTDFKVDHLML